MNLLILNMSVTGVYLECNEISKDFYVEYLEQLQMTFSKCENQTFRKLQWQ